MIERQNITKRGQLAIEEVANQENISVEEVRKEMSIAIEEAMRSDDPHAKALWNSLFPGNHVPSPEEFIAVIAAEVEKATQINSNFLPIL